MELLSIFTLLIGLAVGAVTVWFVLRGKLTQQAAAAVADKELAVTQLTSAHELQLERQSAELRSKIAVAETRVSELDKRNAELSAQLQQRDSVQQQEQKVLQQLTPLQESLAALQKRVNEAEEQRSEQHGQLINQLSTAAQSEQKMLGAANSLVTALTQTNVRGSWGEATLERLLEQSGLTKHIDYKTQATLTAADSESRQRPDLVLQLPQNRFLAIDAKAPLNALIKHAQSGGAAELSAAEFAQAKTQHAKALRSHIDAISAKNYQSLFAQSLDMTILFVPADSLLTYALEADPQLLDYAYGKNVALASPISLWAILKAVQQSWQHEAVNSEAQQIFDICKNLYSKLETLAEHLTKLGKSLNSSVKNYNSLIGSLERTYLPEARKITKIDDTALKPKTAALGEQEITEAVREIVAPEITAEVLHPADSSDSSAS